jgi:peptidoglycan/LPS O-acetylase OafA/YrhL
VSRRLARFSSSSAGLIAVVCVVICAVQPFEWWQRLILAVVITPVVVLSTSRFFGVEQLWEWKFSRGEQDDDA